MHLGLTWRGQACTLCRQARVLSWVVLVTLAGCGDDAAAPASPQSPQSPQSPSPPSPPPATALAALVSDAASTHGTDSVAWVSLTPGTVLHGARLDVRNAKTGTKSTFTLEAGGRDPVTVPASPGQDLAITAIDSAGVAVTTLARVLPRVAPRVVRASPGPRATNIPLNVKITVVFSEPVALPTVSDATLMLSVAGTPVDASVTLSADGLVAIIEPVAGLAPTSEYNVTATVNVSDLTGDGLVPFVTTFTTGSTSEPPTSEPPTSDPPTSDPPVPPAVNEELVFTRGGDLFIMRSDGTGIRQLTSGVGEDFEAAWSPDGTRIAFTRYRAELGSFRWGDAAIYVINADGTGLARLSAEADSTFDAHPTWSADGARIAFWSTGWNKTQGTPMREDDTAIYVMNQDGTNPVRLTFDNGYAYHPAWSPDGSRISYLTLLRGVPGFRIHVMDADGSNTVVFDAGAHAAAWSPDGSRLVVALEECTQWSGEAWVSDCMNWSGPYLTAMNADGSNRVRLSTHMLRASSWAEAVPVAWSPDGQLIAFTEDGCDEGASAGTLPCGPPGLYLLNVSDGRITRLTEGALPVWRP